jgi:N-acetylneuraminic acid mutarotase
VVDRGGTAQRLAVALAGVGLAVSSCTASPEPTASEGSSEPSATQQASSSPDQAAARWIATGETVQARPDHTATLLQDGRVLVVGGFDPTFGDVFGFVATAQLYDSATGSWTLTGAMNDGRYGHTATLLDDGRVLVAGGSGGNGILASAELYDPATGLWTHTGPMLEARVSHTASLLPNGKVLVAGFFFGGSEGAHSLATAELFDPETGSWTAAASMNEARGLHTATLLRDGSVMVAGGTAGSPFGDVYDPTRNAWTPTSPMVVGAAYTATLLPDDTVLVTGDPVQLYDPASNIWTTTGPMIHVWNEHTATLLDDGTVLVIGGYDTNGDGAAEGQLYDPSSGSWVATAAMIDGRVYHSATLLQDGTVLVAGGAKTIYADALDELLSSAELYYPTAVAP